MHLGLAAKAMLTDGSIRQQMIRRILLENAGGLGANARAVADATVRTWMRAAAELALLIGQGGVRALYERSLHLTRAIYPWLSEAEAPVRTDAPFATLQVSLESGEPEDALEAGAAFLIVCTDLLSNLIGEALTTRLVDSSWIEDAAEQAKKEPRNE
jgi:hypothetical protein